MIAAVKHVARRGHRAGEVAEGFGVSLHSLYTWTKRYGVPEEGWYNHRQRRCLQSLIAHIGQDLLAWFDNDSLTRRGASMPGVEGRIGMTTPTMMSEKAWRTASSVGFALPSFDTVTHSRRARAHYTFYQLSVMPPAPPLFTNIDATQTRCDYQNDVKELMGFVDIGNGRSATPAVPSCWPGAASWSHAARPAPPSGGNRRCLSSIFDALCEANAMQVISVDGVERSRLGGQEGSTAAIVDHHARDAGHRATSRVRVAPRSVRCNSSTCTFTAKAARSAPCPCIRLGSARLGPASMQPLPAMSRETLIN